MLLLSEERGNGHADRQAAAMSGEASSDISAEEEGDNAASPSHEKRLKTAKRKRQWRKATNTIRKVRSPAQLLFEWPLVQPSD
jgi:hypothetical protein